MTWNTFEKRGFLRVIKAQAANSNLSLEAALLGILQGRFTNVRDGRVLISFSNEAGSSGWQPPGGKNQADVLSLVSELMDRRDDAIEALGGGDLNDEQVFQQMMTSLRAVKGYVFDPMYMAK